MTCMTLDRSTFEAVLGPLQDIIDKAAKARDEAAKHVQQRQQQAGLAAADRSCFKLKRRLCVHSYGAVVYLALHARSPDAKRAAAPSNKEYTMRLESIATIAKAGTHEEVLAEVSLLRAVHADPRLPKAILPPLLATFRDERALYWVFQVRHLHTSSPHLTATSHQ